MIDVTAFVQGLIGLLAALVTGLLIPWIRAKTTAQQQSALSMVADVLVYAAEQMYGSGMGQEKLTYVRREMEKRGFTVDMAVIEAAVRRMNEQAAGIQTT